MRGLTDTLQRAARHEQLVFLCSFQKEESVILDELLHRAPHARVVTIDTGVLFPETLQTWRAFEERFGVHVEVEDASGPWAGPEHCCGDAKVAALERALAGGEAWITGIRREQAATRVGAEFVEWDTKRSIWKYNPLADWTEEDVWSRIVERDLPYHPLHDQGYASIGCAPCTQPGQRPRGPLGRHRQDRVRAPRRVIDPLVICFGLGVGVLIGMTGIGGGSLMTPLLILFAGVQPVVAIGTDLAYGAITKTVGGWRHLRTGTVDLGVSKWLAVGSVPGAIAGVLLVDALHDRYGDSFDTTLLGLVAAALFIVAFSVLGRALFGVPRERHSVPLTGRTKVGAAWRSGSCSA